MCCVKRYLNNIAKEKLSRTALTGIELSATPSKKLVFVTPRLSGGFQADSVLLVVCLYDKQLKGYPFKIIFIHIHYILSAQKLKQAKKTKMLMFSCKIYTKSHTKLDKNYLTLLINSTNPHPCLNTDLTGSASPSNQYLIRNTECGISGHTHSHLIISPSP